MFPLRCLCDDCPNCNVDTNTKSKGQWKMCANCRHSIFFLGRLLLPPAVKAYEYWMHSISASFSFHCHQHKQWKLMNTACTVFLPHSAFIATYTNSEGLWILNAQHFLLNQPSLSLTQTVKTYEYCMHSISASSSFHYHQHCMHNLSLGSTLWMLTPLFGMAGQWCPCSVCVIMVTLLWCVCQRMSWRYSGRACTPFRSCFSGPFIIGVWKWPLFSGKDVMWVLDTVICTCFEKSVSLLKVSWYQF